MGLRLSLGPSAFPGLCPSARRNPPRCVGVRCVGKLRLQLLLAPNVRFGALSLVSPVFLALMHQDSLDGSACRPLDLEEMIPAHVEAWIRGHS